MTRIIAGRAGSLRLEVPKAGTRPTSDRVREAIFSTLGSWGLVDGARVLDLYAGSGALGLEAVSRGAHDVVLVEKHPGAAQVAARNVKTVLQAFAGEDQPRVEARRSSVLSFLEGAREQAGHRFDVIMLDPPYDVSEADLAEVLAVAAPLLDTDGVLLVERSTRSTEPTWPDSLSLLRHNRYGETALWWAEAAQ